MALAQSKYEFFQQYEDCQTQGLTLAQTQSLLKEYMEKMPDEMIDSFISKDAKEENSSGFTYSSTNKSQLIEPKNAPVFFLETKPLKERAIALQKWRGIVEEVEQDHFKAKLINLTDRAYDEYGEIYYDEITQEDIELIEPGAIFYWSIGYSHSSSGQRTRFSEIRFKRLPVWDEKDIELAEQNAERISEFIEWR